MRKQPKKTAQKLGAAEPEVQAEAEAVAPASKKKRHHKRGKTEKAVNRLNIESFEANLKNTTEVPKEKLDLGVDLEQRKRAYTAQSAPKTYQQAEIVAGASVKDRVASLYGDKRDVEARRGIEVPGDMLSVKDRAASLLTVKERDNERERPVVAMSLEERKQALYNRTQSQEVSSGAEIKVDRDLKSRMTAYQTPQSKPFEKTAVEAPTGPSLQERMKNFNKPPEDRTVQRTAIEPAMTLAERKRMLEEAHAAKARPAPMERTGSIKDKIARYQNSDESGSESGESGSGESYESEGEGEESEGEVGEAEGKAPEVEMAVVAEAQVEVEQPQIAEVQAVDAQAEEVHAEQLQIVEAQGVEPQAEVVQAVEPQVDQAQGIELQAEQPKEAEANAAQAHGFEPQAEVVQAEQAQAVEPLAEQPQAAEADAEQPQAFEPKPLEAVAEAADAKVDLDNAGEHALAVFAPKVPAEEPIVIAKDEEAKSPHPIAGVDEVYVPPMPKRSPPSKLHNFDDATDSQLNLQVQEIEGHTAP